MTRRKKKLARHAVAAVRAHLARHHPSCPPAIIDEIARRIDGRLWSPPVSIGEAVGIAADGYVRHKLTDYERLLKVHSLTREEARLIVNPEVNDIIRSWNAKSAKQSD
jgi:hypothetical protein